MLSQLSIRDIVLIGRLDIAFSGGLSVLTGETGAGKSILLDALSLALGARGDGGLVRTGASEGTVSAVFEPERAHPVFQILQENSIESDGLIILRRVQGADGRTRAFINDAPVSAGLMRNIGAMLVEIHGQHDDRALLDPQSHLKLLDAFGELEPLAASVATAYRNWRKSEEAREKLQQEVEAAQREAEYLRASCEELSVLAPQSGEETELADLRQKLMQVEAVASDLAEANEVLSGNASPVTVISNLARQLERKRAKAPDLVEETLAQLDEGLNALYNAQATLEAAITRTEFDPGELERSEERLFALRAASRKYSVAVENLPELAVKMADDLALLDDGAQQLKTLEKECAALRESFDTQARELSERRQTAARALEGDVARELPSLKLEQAEFLVTQENDAEKPSESGIDSVEFWVKTNPGTRAGPMRKVASGGELARFLLALKVALADKGSAPTLVFDEIDSGVGGAVADAIGKRLARLAGDVQVLSVTHAPQVAARANGHFLISKSPSGNGASVETAVQSISEEVRLEEIARMLSGAQVTDEARAAAATLIAQP